MKDWTGNKSTNRLILGMSTNPLYRREKDDFYATDPKATKLLLTFGIPFKNILEPACGQGHLAKVFDKAGLLGDAFDIIDRGYGRQMNFFNPSSWKGDTILRWFN